MLLRDYERQSENKRNCNYRIGIMGCESFQAVLVGSGYSEKEVLKYLKDNPNIRIDKEAGSYHKIHGEHYFIYNDEKHIIEIEVRSEKRGKIRMSTRFALCQSVSVHLFFQEFVKNIAGKFGFSIFIAEEVGNEKNGIFLPPNFSGFDETLQCAIKLKQSWWIKDFGPETATVTCSEAILKFVVPKCR
jgi:hypothetical protein